jgi:hypothetical protein
MVNPTQTTETRRQFRTGDPIIVLYDGRTGRFLGLRTDPNWADIEGSNGLIRSHPVQWLRPATEAPRP